MNEREVIALDSPIGTLDLELAGDVVVGLRFGDSSPRRPGDAEPPNRWAQRHMVGREPVAAIERYFAGDLAALESIETQLVGTPFQRAVWAALLRIPVGEVASYAKIAAEVGRPGAARAVGQANHHNPVAVIVPCHRVVAADGTLGGYGGGLDRKRWLLAHEGATGVHLHAQGELLGTINP
jgi:methylated-DNA-[protein]-cysteine S-methyltransferase